MQQKRLERITSVVRQRQKDFIVVLEDVHDPHNAAAILRTCDGLGIQNIYFIFEKQKAYNPKKVGKTSSSSANKWLDFTIFRSTKDCIDVLHKNGYAVIATAITDRAENLSSASFTEKKIALLVGTEHAGLSETALSMADRIVMIPMVGFVQSYNVSVSAAIILWDVITKRKIAPLSKTEQQKLIDNFIKR